VACGADGARPAWRSTELSPAAGVRVRLGRDPRGDTGEVWGGAGGWARGKSGFIFPIFADSYSCERDARMSVLSFGDGIVGAIEAHRFLGRCLEAKGYYQVPR
jgi:hypothetical protein